MVRRAEPQSSAHQHISSLPATLVGISKGQRPLRLLGRSRLDQHSIRLARERLLTLNTMNGIRQLGVRTRPQRAVRLDAGRGLYDLDVYPVAASGINTTSAAAESTFVIIGTDRDRKTGALLALLARADEYGLAYAGSGFIALSGIEREELRSRLESMKVGRCPIGRLRLPSAEWVQPRLVARVHHLAGAKHLRHGTVSEFLAAA